MAPREYLGAWGTLIHEKNLKSKISCQTPFKYLEDGEGSLDWTVVHELQLDLLHVPPDGVALASVGLVLIIRHLHHPTLRCRHPF